MSVNLGPVSVPVPNSPKNPLSSGLGYNPRCLRRDVNPNAAAVTTDNYTSSLITNPQNKDVYWFQTDMQGKTDIGEWGVHRGGHFSVGGDPGGVSLLFQTHPLVTVKLCPSVSSSSYTQTITSSRSHPVFIHAVKSSHWPI